MIDSESGHRSYVYSAYVDDRKAPDVQSSWLPVLRLFVWMRRSDAATVTRWRCLIWNENFTQPIASVVVGWTDLNTFDTNSE